MESLYLLVPLSVLAVFGIGWVFWRAVCGGQFDDLDRPGLDVVMDDDRPPASTRMSTVEKLDSTSVQAREPGI